MSQFDLTLAWGLVAIAVIGGVWLFNAWQERTWRRRAQDAFRQQHSADALLGELPSEKRREPRFGLDRSPAGDDEDDEDEEEPGDAAFAATTPGLLPSAKAVILDPEIDYIVTLQLEAPVSPDELRRAMEHGSSLERAPLWEGLHELYGWEPLDVDNASRYLALRAGLQLVNRSGPVEQTLLSRFCDSMQYSCDRWQARIQYPDRRHALEQARKLDQFCAGVDVIIGLNLVSRDGRPINMGRVIQLADAAGMQANAPQGWLFRDEEQRPLFSLVHIEGQPIDPSRVRTMSCFGLTFTLDVPKVSGGVAAFDRVAALARHFAQQLEVDLVDDHRQPLTDAALDTIRQQLAVIYSNMELRGLLPGSAVVFRVFS